MRLIDRKSTRLNSSHLVISYAVFCLKKEQIDHAVEATITQIENVSGTVKSAVLRPVREVSGIAAGIAAMVVFFNGTATTEIYTLSLHDALPIWKRRDDYEARHCQTVPPQPHPHQGRNPLSDRKSTRLNSSHLVISYAVFCL